MPTPTYYNRQAGALPDTPGAGDGGNGSGTSPGDPPLGRPHDPDPQPGRRVSMRPQPTRAPRDEAMALGPHRGREPAQALAKGPTLKWGSGGMARGTAAEALRLLLAPGVTGTATNDPPPPRQQNYRTEVQNWSALQCSKAKH